MFQWKDGVDKVSSLDMWARFVYVLVMAVERSCGCGVEHMIVMAYGELCLWGLNVEVEGLFVVTFGVLVCRKVYNVSGRYCVCGGIS